MCHQVKVSVTVCDLVTEPAVALTVMVKLPSVAGNTELIVNVDAPSDGFGVTDIEAFVGRPATLMTAPVVPRALPATEMLYRATPPLALMLVVTGVTESVSSPATTGPTVVVEPPGSVVVVTVFGPVTVRVPPALRVTPPPVAVMVNGYEPVGVFAGTVNVSVVLELFNFCDATDGATPVGNPVMPRSTCEVNAAVFETLIVLCPDPPCAMAKDEGVRATAISVTIVSSPFAERTFPSAVPATVNVDVEAGCAGGAVSTTRITPALTVEVLETTPAGRPDTATTIFAGTVPPTATLKVVVPPTGSSTRPGLTTNE
jgi:hypothetical protein